MTFFEPEYIMLLNRVRDEGVLVESERTGTGTLMLTNAVLEHSDCAGSFPALLTKRLAFKAILGELQWFIEGSSNIERLRYLTHGTDWESKSTIWDANLKDYNDKMGFPPTNQSLGPIYGRQWRCAANGSDQLSEVIQRLKTNPHDRRLVVSAWNAADIEKMALPPCHMIFQFNVIGDRLDLAMFQRSGDLFLGVPFNMASYAVLLHLVAQEVGLTPGKVTIMIGNAHIYLDHLEQVTEQINRFKTGVYTNYYPNKNGQYTCLPGLDLSMSLDVFNGRVSSRMDDLFIDNIHLTNYHPLPTIKGAMSV